jgi:hypothetical protein
MEFFCTENVFQKINKKGKPILPDSAEPEGPTQVRTSPATSPPRSPIWRCRPPRAGPGLAGVRGHPAGAALPLGVRAGYGSVSCAPHL